MTAADITPSNPSPFDAIRRVSDAGREYWSARDLQPLMGYSRWEDFAKIIRRAESSASNSGHTGGFSVITEEGTGGRPRINYQLSRFAAYLVAMNGDPNMSEVAAAQAYFAVRTREAETRRPAPALEGRELIAAALIESQKVLEQREARIFQLEQVVTEQAPKVTYVDTYVTDADLLSFSTVASTNNITEKALRELLIDRDWIYVQTDSRWSNSHGKKIERRRYSEKADKKRYFRRVETHEAPRFRGSEVMHTLKITPQGAEAIARLIAKGGLS
ncbi:antirepressor [Gordonia phage Lysidious]|nr:antirepressor [Gordonia phage Lysidious]